MQSHCISSALLPLLSTFERCFTGPGFRHFVAVMTAWVVTRGRPASHAFGLVRETGDAT